MASLYITSITPGAGKTAVAAGLVALLTSQDKSARYLKPLAVGSMPDADTQFCRATLGPATAGEPRMASAGALAGGLGALASTLQADLRGATSGAGALIIDGLPASSEFATSSRELAAATNSLVIGVVRYQRWMVLQHVDTLKNTFGDRLLGVILNAVPKMSLRAASEETAPALRQLGTPVLGIIPEERLLLGFTVAEYGQKLGGTILNNEERASGIIENILVGANVTDSAQFYYERVPNKALLTRGDRPDLQFTALETSTRCLILTQGIQPIPYILDKAVEAAIPVMVVPKGTIATIAEIEKFVTSPTFHHPEKLAKVARLIEAHLDREALKL